MAERPQVVLAMALGDVAFAARLRGPGGPLRRRPGDAAGAGCAEAPGQGALMANSSQRTRSMLETRNFYRKLAQTDWQTSCTSAAGVYDVPLRFLEFYLRLL